MESCDECNHHRGCIIIIDNESCVHAICHVCASEGAEQAKRYEDCQ